MNLNGQLVCEVLEEFEEPVTSRQLVTRIAELAQVPPKFLKDSVTETLVGGARYGFIQRMNHKYCTNDVYQSLNSHKNRKKNSKGVMKDKAVLNAQISLIEEPEEESQNEEEDSDDDAEQEEVTYSESETASKKSLESIFSCDHNCCCSRSCKLKGHNTKSCQTP